MFSRRQTYIRTQRVTYYILLLSSSSNQITFSSSVLVLTVVLGTGGPNERIPSLSPDKCLFQSRDGSHQSSSCFLKPQKKKKLDLRACLYALDTSFMGLVKTVRKNKKKKRFKAIPHYQWLIPS